MGGLLGTLKRHLLQGLGLHPETPREHGPVGGGLDKDAGLHPNCWGLLAGCTDRN